MTQRGPWSVKGIDTRAREAAREAAREEGLTLGAYLNRLILEEGGEPDFSPSGAFGSASSGQHGFSAGHSDAPNNASAVAMDRLTRRLESAEARSTLAITGIDQSVVGLLSRIENSEHSQQAMGNHIEGVLGDIRATYDTLSDKIQKLEANDASSTNLRALKAIEDALGKLASHVYQEGELVGEETNAIKMRLETGLSELTERIGDIDARIETVTANTGAASDESLTGRVEELEANTALKLAHVDQMASSMDSVHEHVTGSIQDMAGNLNEVQERLNQAETTTNDALQALEQQFSNLNVRLETAEASAGPDAEAHEEMRRLFEDRFEGLTGELRGLIASTRAELAEEIEAATKTVDNVVIARMVETVDTLSARMDSTETLNNQAMEMVGDTVSRITDSVDQRLTANQAQQSRAIEQVGEQVSRISDSLEQRVDAIENSKDGAHGLREEMLNFTSKIDSRLDDLESRDSDTVERVRSEVEKLADRFEARVSETEKESANAIEQIGEQVTGVTSRIEGRQVEALKAFSDKLDATQKRQESRLSSALDSVSTRLESLQEQSISSISPVQRAIAALAHRIEAMEDFTAPPFVARDAVSDLPEMTTPQKIDTAFDDADDLTSIEDAHPQFGADTSSETDALLTSAFEADAEIATEDEAVNPFAPALKADELESLLTPDLAADTALASQSSDDFEVGYESWADKTDIDLETDLRGLDAAPESTGSDSPEYYSAPPPPPIDTMAEDDLWDDGGDEARDSDIFASESFGEDTQGDSLASAIETEIGRLEEEAESDTDTVSFTPTQDDKPDDMIAAARKAALAAAASSTSPKAGRSKRAKASGSQGGNKRPAIAAVSTLAVVAIAGTSGALYMRGQQETSPLQLDAETTPSSEQVESTAAAALASILNGGAEAQGADASLPAGEVALPKAETAIIFSEPEAVAEATPVTEAFSAPVIPARITLEQAAAEGNGIAQFQRGMSLLAANKPAEGAELIETAAAGGFAPAQHQMALLHEQGLGTTRDVDAAREWHKSAAENGNVQAMFDYASYNAEDDSGPQTDQIAAEYFRKAAETGHTNSQYNLALMFATGRGVSPSQVEAFYWLELASLGGDADAREAIKQLVASDAVSDDAVRQVRDRAATWIATPADPVANGQFGKQPWEAAAAVQVRPAQQVLNALGYQVGVPDGAMGQQTRDAIGAFEADNGLPVTGTLSADVVDALNKAAEARRGA